MGKKRKPDCIILCTSIILCFIAIRDISCLDDLIQKELKNICPSLVPEVYENSILFGGRNAGNYEMVAHAKNLTACTYSCCQSKTCHIALLHNMQCVNVKCSSSEACQVKPGRNGTTVVVVRNVSSEDIGYSNSSRNASSVEANTSSSGASASDINKTLISKEKTDLRCEVGLMQCPKNQECISFGNHRRNGLCKCLSGYIQDSSTDECLPSDNTVVAASEASTAIPSFSDESESTSLSATVPASSSLPNGQSASSPGIASPKPIEKLVVSINNKTVTLPSGKVIYEDSVMLSAYAIGAPTGMKYEWTLIMKPETDVEGSVSDANSQTITLSHLVQGVYIFEVLVDAPGVHGEAVGNVTVLPAKRINQPPKAVIIPPSQKIKLPNSGVILDGSSSIDDMVISSYHWEIVTAPLGYKLSEETGATLQLTDLIPGNYTIMLHVKDEEGLEGNTTTFVNVVKETDYPPTANAGGDQIIYLPQRDIILYGNASIDDHGIEGWEWTKGPKDSGKAVDMQDTRTPYLHLSNLEEGHYQFILRVTDGNGQSSEAPVNVFVQKPNMNIPKADAGDDLQLVLPNTSVVLDGSRTTDTTPNTHWLWQQISGPNTVHFIKTDEMKVNLSNLTKGKYVFMLSTWNGDDPAKNSTDNITVSVIQDKNVSPKANAGGDFSMTLPVSVVVVDGSKSTDDVAVSKWLWEREPTSLAAGKVINGSDQSPLLMFTDVVSGVYIWKLTVWDDQSASNSDTVSIIVKEGQHYLDEVELLVGGDIGTLSYSQLSTLLQKLELFLHISDHSVIIHLLSATGIPRSGHVRLSFLVFAGENIVKGPEVVSLLRHQIISESSDILDLPLISIDTVVCQNNCSGHGECIQSSRECRCQTWWMESFIRRHMGDGYQNCDWSVVYVFVTICILVISIALVIWGIIALLVRKFGGNVRPRRKLPRYSLLDNHEETNKCDHSCILLKRKKREKTSCKISREEEKKVKTHLPGNLLDSGSESESDAEVLFDSRKTKHKNDKQRNGYQKLARIRT
ncbi:hypothetical protein SK128_004936 [Halocaridina rubra]|uniref:PKD/Chitinase domain-containing protein n=1 Tax=Halocaridina rubra TaxID=373956 RepID=A0AAN9ADF6_HALRR